MDVIFDPTEENRLAPDGLQDTRHISEQPSAKIRVFEKRHTVLRAEDNMEDDASKRLRHGGDRHAPLGLCPFAGTNPRAALVPRLPWAGLRQAFGLSISAPKVPNKPAQANGLGSEFP